MTTIDHYTYPAGGAANGPPTVTQTPAPDPGDQPATLNDLAVVLGIDVPTLQANIAANIASVAVTASPASPAQPVSAIE